MPLQRLLDGSALGAEDVKRLCCAYEHGLRTLYLVDRNDPISGGARGRRWLRPWSVHVVMAQAFPQSHFTGFDCHPASIDRARTGQRKPASMSAGKELLEHPEHVPSVI